MILSLEKSKLARYIDSQLGHLFPDNISHLSQIDKALDTAIQRMDVCFSAVNNNYFRDNGQARFNHLNSDQYAMLLYFLANTLYRNEEDIRICEKTFYLNKIMHGIDVFYSVELPEIFLFCHPLGTVLGRAQYSNYFLVYQGCTVGASREEGFNKANAYPVIGEYAALYMGSSILGKSRIGANCKIASNSVIIDKDLTDNSIYIGTPSNSIVKVNNHHDPIWDL